MTDTLRNMPRYIRNTDAFGWQGADEPNGPWRSIAPPQSGTPWQTTNPMDDLRQASAEVSGVEVLSPAALSVWCRFCEVVEEHGPPRLGLAAALRAAVDQVMPEERKPSADSDYHLMNWTKALDTYYQRKQTRAEILAIATELESHQ